MKVLHLGKFDAHGGIETHVRSLLGGVTATGGVSAVNLVVNDRAFTDAHHRYGWQTVRAASYGRVASVALCPSLPLQVARLHSEHRFDIVHLHFPDPLGQLASSVLPRSVARVITWHSDIVRQKLALIAYQPMLSSFVSSADAVIAATPFHFSGSTQIPVALPESRRFVIPYALDPTRLRPTSRSTSKVAELRAQAAGQFAVFAIGRLVYYKGFDVLVRAMKDVPGRLWLAGDGPLRPQLQRLVASLGLEHRVTLCGSVAEEELPAYYEASDAFCLPSVERSEAFGLVQLEAMQFGKPVVSTRLNTGVDWVNQHDTTGLTVLPGQPAPLADALNRLAGDVALRERLGTAGRQRVSTVFSPAAMVQQTLAVYQRVIAERRRC